MVPRQQAGHMLAIDLPVNILLQSLASRGRPHMPLRRPTDGVS
jgi:hypothetical protein